MSIQLNAVARAHDTVSLINSTSSNPTEKRALTGAMPKFTLKQIVARYPGLVLPVVKTTVNTGANILFLPLSSMINIHIIKGQDLSVAYRTVRKAPFAGWQQVLMSEAVKTGAIFASQQAYIELFLSQGYNREQAEQWSLYPAAMTGSIASCPSDTLKTRRQMQLPTDYKTLGFRGYFRGLSPVMLNNLGKWGVGFSIGHALKENVEPILGDSTIAKLAADTMGWTIGSFICSPFFNMQLHLRVDTNLNSMKDVLLKLNVLYDPNGYSADKYKVTHTFQRLVLLMPLDQKIQPSINENQTGMLRAFHIITNGSGLWRGFPKGLAVIIATGLAISSAKETASRLMED